MKHAKEPWEVQETPSSAGRLIISAGGPPKYSNVIAGVEVHWEVNSYEGKANAERIVSCVNSCAGLNPEAVPELLVVAKELNEVVFRINSKQADNGAFQSVVRQAQEAIAKAEVKK